MMERRRAHRALLSLVVACAGSGGCSLLVSTSGLAGDAPDGGVAQAGDGGDANVVVTDATAGETGALVEGGADASANCDFGKPFGALVAFPTPVSSASNETAGYFSPDRLTLYAGSTRAGAGDLLVFRRATLTSAWDDPEALVNLNSAQADSDPWVSADQLTVYFDSDRPAVFGGRNLFTSTRATVTSPFSPPVLVEGTSSVSNELAPWLPPSGDKIYFASDRDGKAALYVSQRSGASFSVPTLVAGVELPAASQESPFLTADERTIYFASDRDGPAGNFDIYVATRASAQSSFTSVTRVAELSTGGRDYPTWLSDDGCKMIVESYVTGNAELYYSERPK